MWTIATRAADLSMSGLLEVESATVVVRFNGVGAWSARAAFTADAWNRLAPGCGVVIRNENMVVLSGPVTARAFDDQDGSAAIEVAGLSDETLLQDHIVYPDPAEAGTDQTTESHWRRTAVAETVLKDLVREQIGADAQVTREVPGLTVAADLGRGVSVTATIRYGNPTMLSEMQNLAEAGGLGFRITTVGAGLVFECYEPSDKAATIRFGTGLGNLQSHTYTEAAPTTTYALAGGSGELTARIQRSNTSTDPATLTYGRRIETYVDRRDTAVPSELVAAAKQAVTDGIATASVKFSPLDSEGQRAGVDYQTGDKVTVYCGPFDYALLGTVEDIIREIRYDITPESVKVTPAVGPDGTTSGVLPPSYKAIRDLGSRLSVIERN